MEPLHTDTDPRVVGPFELLARLGAGGMGVAYLARRIPLDGPQEDLAAAYNLVDPHDADAHAADPGGAGDDASRLVVVKMVQPHLLDGNPQARERFGREIDAVRAVVGDRVPALLAFEEDPRTAARPWFAMEYIAGPSLSTLVNEAGPLDAGPCAALGLALVDALRAIHGANLLHRDLKPGNVVLGPRGPVVLDFGLAVLIERASGPALTQSGIGMGTKQYMPLEQARNAKHVDRSADVYALGATLFFALTGRPAYPYGPMPSEPDWQGVAAAFLPLLGKILVPVPGQRPGLDSVANSLLDLLAATGLTPLLAADRLRAQVEAADLTPKLPPGALTDDVDPDVQELVRQAIDADLPDVTSGFFGIVDTDDIEWAADLTDAVPVPADAVPAPTGDHADADRLEPGTPAEPDADHADTDGPQVPAPPTTAPAPTSYRLPPPTPPAGPTPPQPPAAQAPPHAAQRVAAGLRRRYAHRGTL